MLLDATPKIEDLIVTTLSRRSLSASKIKQELDILDHNYTVQAIYKALRILEGSGVIVKNKRKYSLRLSWIVELSDLADKATVNLSRVKLPHTNQRIIWHFHDMQRLNNFWSQILLQLIKNTKSKTLFTWMPHPWYHMAYAAQEEQYIESLTLTKTKLYLINGGQTYLDRWTEKYWQKPNIEYSFAESKFNQTAPQTYINVMDDYILTVRLDDKINQEIDQFYSTIKSYNDVEFSEVFRIFGLKIKASVWLEKNPKKAAIYRKRFQKFFGI